VVPSARSQWICELGVIELLIDHGVIVICAAGGGIPTARGQDGSLAGVEAAIDKDLASALLARELRADASLMLTIVNAVFEDWRQPQVRAICRASPYALDALSFKPGSIGPKAEAACEFVERTGGMAGIGRIADVLAILHDEGGTVIAGDAIDLIRWD
jgi:carbamate kinase